MLRRRVSRSTRFCRPVFIYCHRAALVKITRRGCGGKFLVRVFFEITQEAPDLTELIRARQLCAAGSSNISCCAAEPTMNSEPHRVLEYCHVSPRKCFRGKQWGCDPFPRKRW